MVAGGYTAIVPRPLINRVRAVPFSGDPRVCSCSARGRDTMLYVCMYVRAAGEEKALNNTRRAWRDDGDTFWIGRIIFVFIFFFRRFWEGGRWR